MLEIERVRFAPGRALCVLVTAASLLFLASVVFGADQFTGLSGQPIQRATAW